MIHLNFKEMVFKNIPLSNSQMSIFQYKIFFSAYRTRTTIIHGRAARYGTGTGTSTAGLAHGMVRTALCGMAA
jgi:hypothetical protein